MKRVLKHDAQTGQTVTMDQNSDGTTYIENTQNFDNLLKLNKHMADDWTPGQMMGSQKHMAHVAEIPNVLYNQLVNKFGRPADNPEAWKKWLNDSENRVFRTGGGYI